MRVLVIEDDDGILAMIDDILTDDGHFVVKSKGQHSIPSLVREHRPDVIILDLSLPFTSGEAILQMLWQADDLRSTPVIVSSAWRVWAHRVYKEAQQRGQPVLLLHKPYGYHDLIRALQTAAGLQSP